MTAWIWGMGLTGSIRNLRFVIRWRIGLLIILAAIGHGCAPEKSAEQPLPAAVKVPSDLKLVVIDDAPLAGAVEQLRAEWRARLGDELTVVQATEDFVDNQEVLSADAVIYPSRMLGQLAESKLIVPFPADFIANRELARSDTFELLQIGETNWARRPYAVAFGSPVLTLYVRSDLLATTHQAAPEDWHAYHQLADFLGRRENVKAGPAANVEWQGSLQPLAKGWAGRVLLARAAPYVKHRNNFSALFDIETMEPLIAGEGFVRALEELVADFKLGTPAQIEMDPTDVREAFLAGKSALAIAWPGHSDQKSPQQHIATAFAELPGAGVVYNFADQTWERRHDQESPHVTTLGLAGRLGSVTTHSARPLRAMQLLAWLSGREWGTRVSSSSSATTLFRRSQMRTPQPWVDPGTEATAAAEYAESVQAALSRQQYLQVLRIPGEAEYMDALDHATREVLKGEKTSKEALAETAAKWRAITDRLGLAKQKTAYRASLGFEL
jgi:multiple sugar transport system substrate-binding protein